MTSQIGCHFLGVILVGEKLVGDFVTGQNFDCLEYSNISSSKDNLNNPTFSNTISPIVSEYHVIYSSLRKLTVRSIRQYDSIF